MMRQTTISRVLLHVILMTFVSLAARGQLGLKRGTVAAGADAGSAGAASASYRLWSAAGVRCTYTAALSHDQTPDSSINAYDGYMIPRTHLCALPRMTHTLSPGWSAVGFPRTGEDSCGVTLGLDGRNNSDGPVFSHVAGSRAYVGAWSLPTKANHGAWAYTLAGTGETPGTSRIEMTGKPSSVALSLAGPGWLFHAPTLITPIDQLGVQAWRWDAGTAVFVRVTADGSSVADRFLLPGHVYWLCVQ